MYRAGAWTDVTGSQFRILFDGPLNYGVLWHPGFNLSSTFHSHSLFSLLPPSANKLLLPCNRVLYSSTNSVTPFYTAGKMGWQTPIQQQPVMTITLYLIDALYCSFVRRKTNNTIQCDDWPVLCNDLFTGSTPASLIFPLLCDFSAESFCRTFCILGICLTFLSTDIVLLHGPKV